MKNLDEKLEQVYLADCREHLAAIETDLLAIGTGRRGDDDERLNRILRALRAIGGPAEYFEFSSTRDLAHQSEELVAMIRSRQNTPAPEQILALMSARDKLCELVQASEINRIETTSVMAELAELTAGSPAPAGASGSSAAAFHRRDGRPLRILVTEDDFACRLLLQTFLSRYGQCHVAVNGQEAVEAFRLAFEQDNAYDLVCMDIMMPQMDGREAVRRIRAFEETRGIHSHHGVKIFMTTTVGEIREVFSCFNELCDAYLLKPIDLGQLLERLSLHQLIQ